MNKWLLAAVFFWGSLKGMTQTFFEYPSNPVIDVIADPDPSEEWTQWKTDPYLIHWSGDSLRMYYGTNNIGEQTQIGTAVSADGNVWIEKRDVPVVGIGPDGTWDELHVETPGVIYVPSNPDSMKYMLYYSGIGHDYTVLDSVIPGLFPTEIVQMGLAYSPDGIHFTKYNDPTNDGTWAYAFSDPVMKIAYTWGGDGWPDDFGYAFASVGEPSPYYDATEGLFKMWFIGLGCTEVGECLDGDYRHRILYSESVNGINWSDPVLVLDIGEDGEFDSGLVYAPHVIKMGTEYWMLYGGNDYSDEGFSFFIQDIGLATSSDGISFTRHDENPVIQKGVDGTWNNLGVNYPACIHYQDSLRVYYSGMPDSLTGFLPKIGYSLLDSTVVGISEYEKLDQFNLYPNPVNDVITISGISFESYRIFNLVGQEFVSGVDLGEGRINVRSLPKGTYLLQLKTSEGILTERKFVKG